jgi:nucleotide-binding universal stress UspA family protein
LLEGQAAERIVELAHERGVDLIALSSHGRSGLSRWNVSSVVQKIILCVYTSVFMARAYQAHQPDLTSLRYRRILVPLDGSQRAEYVLSLLTAVSQEHQAEILLTHVVAQSEIPRRVPLTPEEQELSQRLVELNREEITRYFDQLKSHLPDNAQTRVVISDNVIATLYHLVEDELADLVILSAHGYSATQKFPYGSISISFIAYGATPLLIIQNLRAQEIALNPAEIAVHQQGAGWVLLGTAGAMAQTFGSTCHGAGRMMSRSKAKKRLEADGIHVRAGSMADLAEKAPIAYKDVDRVVEVVHGAGIAIKVARLVPVTVIKG